MAAPLDWVSAGDGSVRSERKGRAAAAGDAAPQPLLRDDGDDDGGCIFPPAGTGAFRSTEDLVKDFEQKLSASFRHFNASPDNIAAVTVIAEETLLEKDE